MPFQSRRGDREVDSAQGERQNFSRAILNILDDSGNERARLGDTQHAVLNILDDAAGEKIMLEYTQRAVLNILSDSVEEQAHLDNTQRAVLNILDDFNIEQKKVRRQAAELARSNKELDSFAYIVSHDLKAPLRGINSLAGWIVADSGDRLDEEGKKQLGMLQSRVQKMHILINGILEYSRIGRVREEMEFLDLNILLPDIIELLSPPSRITIEVQKNLPMLQGEKTRVHQLFQNLLSNAIKYNDKAEGTIRVGLEDAGATWRFTVTDNGLGVDEKYHERIFELFQTLSSSEGSESTGIGLSLAKKIVETYGGTIGVQSKLGQGSTFWFTYPKKYQMKEGENI